MKKALILILVTLTISATYAQVGINADNSAPHSSAQLDLKSTTKAFYPPRMTTAQKNAIASPQAGAVVFDNTLNQLSFYNGTSWVVAASGGLLTLPYNQSQNAATPVFEGLFNITNSYTADGGNAISGTTYSSIGYGVVGKNFSSSAYGSGVAGLHFSGGAGVIGNSNTGPGVSGIADSGIGGLFTSNTGKALITETGNVGIGVSDPLTILDVKSRMRIRHGDETSGIYLDGSTNTYKGFIGMRNDNHIGLYGFNGAGWAFNMNATNGNLGIGNDAPQTKLHVTGGVIRVDALAGSGNRQVFVNSLGDISSLAPVAFLTKITVSPLPIVPAGGSLTVPFNSTDYNLSNFFNTTNYDFNAPVNGIYHFDAFVTFGAVTNAINNSSYFLGIYVDNILTSIVQNPMVNTFEWKTINLSQDLKLNIGQKVKIIVTQTASSNITLTGDSKFSGHLVMRL
jgi:C1q domain